MKEFILTVTISVITFSANAGEWGKAPVGKAPIEECIDLGGEISTGYMTDYLFYGVQFADHSVWTDVNYSFDHFVVPLTLGVWYLNGVDNPTNYDELNLYASAALGAFAGFDVAFGYTQYVYPETRAQGYGEIGLDLTRSFGFVDFAWESNYASGGGGLSPAGWYHQAGIEKSFGLTDSISLVLGAGVGYSDGYFDFLGGSGTAWNHYYAKASLPIQLNCRTTLTPYVGYNGAPDTWIADGIGGQPGQAQSDIFHGGVSISVTF
ncbi:MAG: hypothetical protein KA250_08390 [Verrucomicrobiales bacterium]|jgi:hypothetical protein|nr:hypothetical protein [Verrucomicrobiales bacterium]HQZ27999.1 hypothetical protein [Verrucomicrobiales bacterium]